MNGDKDNGKYKNDKRQMKKERREMVKIKPTRQAKALQIKEKTNG